MTAEKQPRCGWGAGGCNRCVVGFRLGESHRARRDQLWGGWLRSGPDDNVAFTAGHVLPVYLGDTYFKPNSLTTDSGAEVRLRLHNVSPLDQNFKLAAVAGSRGVPPGETILASFRGLPHLFGDIPGRRRWHGGPLGHPVHRTFQAVGRRDSARSVRAPRLPGRGSSR